MYGVRRSIGGFAVIHADTNEVYELHNGKGAKRRAEEQAASLMELDLSPEPTRQSGRGQNARGTHARGR